MKPRPKVRYYPVSTCLDCGGSGFRPDGNRVRKCHCWHRIEVGKGRKIYRGEDGKARAAGEQF